MTELEEFNHLLEKYKFLGLLEKFKEISENNTDFLKIKLNLQTMFDLKILGSENFILKLHSMFVKEFLENLSDKSVKNLQKLDLIKLNKKFYTEQFQEDFVKKYNYVLNCAPNFSAKSISLLSDEEKLSLFYRNIMKVMRDFKKKSNIHEKNFIVLKNLPDDDFSKNLEIFLFYHYKKMLVNSNQMNTKDPDFIVMIQENIKELFDKANLDDDIKIKIQELLKKENQMIKYDAIRINDLEYGTTLVCAILKMIQKHLKNMFEQKNFHPIYKIFIDEFFEKHPIMIIQEKLTHTKYRNVLIDKNFSHQFEEIFNYFINHLDYKKTSKQNQTEVNLIVQNLFDNYIIEKNLENNNEPKSIRNISGFSRKI